jgi:hypothetical protein
VVNPNPADQQTSVSAATAPAVCLALISSPV